MKKPFNKTIWLIIASYVTVLYATTPIMRPAQKFLAQNLDPGQLNLSINMAIIITISVIFIILYKLRPSRALQLLLPLGTLVAMAIIIKRPEERLHLIEYAILAYLTVSALGIRREGLFLALALTIAVGAGDEAIQYVLPDRVGDMRDVMFNSTGGVIGIWFAKLWQS